MTGNPLWKKLDIVERGRVFRVGTHWNGAGPTSANLVLDDLEKHLLNEE